MKMAKQEKKEESSTVVIAILMLGLGIILGIMFFSAFNDHHQKKIGEPLCEGINRTYKATSDFGEYIIYCKEIDNNVIHKDNGFKLKNWED